MVMYAMDALADVVRQQAAREMSRQLARRGRPDWHFQLWLVAEWDEAEQEAICEPDEVLCLGFGNDAVTLRETQLRLAQTAARRWWPGVLVVLDREGRQVGPAVATVPRRPRR